MLAQSQRGQQVNSVFVEGVNPRLHNIRNGLAELELPADELLNHGAPRLVYGLSLISNLRDYLLGIDAQPKYLLPQKDAQAVTQGIVRWWLQRWVAKRVQRADVFERLDQQRLVHPIQHGARVPLPRTDIDQGLLFE